MMTRRDFAKAVSVAGATGMLSGCLTDDKDKGKSNSGSRALDVKDDMYEVKKTGNARILHITDTHGNLLPNYFREPNVNLGMGPAFGKMPHLVGKHLLKELKPLGIKPGSAEAYAYTYLNFEKMAHHYGKTGGFAQIKTVLDSLREGAGGVANTLTVDGGDTWQGSGTSLWTRGRDMIDACNILGVDVMVGHWEFTYKEEEVLNNLTFFKGDFLGQNVRIVEDALFDDTYTKMTETYDGNGLYNEDENMPFKPYTLKNVGGHKIAVIGQAFPRTSNANPKKYFFPDWSFGLREDEMNDLVEEIQEEHKPSAIILVSHNGMDVDIKMASRVKGLDAIFGGHTHDGMPKPIEVKNPDGRTTVVTNAGCSGKYIGVMDLDIQNGKVSGYNYKMLPILSDHIKPNKEMASFITKMRQTKYDKNVVEARNKKFANSKERLGKTYEEILSEKLCKTDVTLYRRGNFTGTWDQVLVNALREEYNSDFAMSMGVRWGTSVPAGNYVTMEDLMTNTSSTYSESYVRDIKGQELVDMLEAIAENLFQKDPYLQSGGDMTRVGGFDYTINPTKNLGERISNLVKDDGTPIILDKTYTISGWAQTTEIGHGRVMWDVAADYLRKQGTLKLAKVNHPTLEGVKDNPGIANYDGKLI